MSGLPPFPTWPRDRQVLYSRPPNIWDLQPRSASPHASSPPSPLALPLGSPFVSPPSSPGPMPDLFLEASPAPSSSSRASSRSSSSLASRSSSRSLVLEGSPQPVMTRRSSPLRGEANVMNPAGPSPSGLRLSMERLSIEVDRASWMVTMVTVLFVLGWLLAYR
jgi:hypothetical protein